MDYCSLSDFHRPVAVCLAAAHGMYIGAASVSVVTATVYSDAACVTVINGPSSLPLGCNLFIKQSVQVCRN